MQFLEARDVMVRTILDLDCVRACVHYFTLESETDRLVETVQEFNRNDGASNLCFSPQRRSDAEKTLTG